LFNCDFLRVVSSSLIVVFVNKSRQYHFCLLELEYQTKTPAIFVFFVIHLFLIRFVDSDQFFTPPIIHTTRDFENCLALMKRQISILVLKAGGKPMNQNV
jgi:hypothetical protein